jgi:hypothetical protein
MELPMKSIERPNPFAVRTPEDISAEEAMRLFVDVFSDFHKVREIGHCFLNGPRGCGKSMMFRYMLPDCQALVHRCTLRELSFFAVLVSIKNTHINITELQRLVKHHANVMLNEHLLVMYVASKTFATLSKLELPSGTAERKETRNFAARVHEALRAAGYQEPLAIRGTDPT